MTDVPRLHRVTRIRGELAPRPGAIKAVNAFFDDPSKVESGKIFTTAQVVVDQDRYHRGEYTRQLSNVERQMAARRMAQRIFRLGQPLRLHENPGGSGRLFFGVHPDDNESLRDFRELLCGIKGIEIASFDDLLYVEFARGALAQNVGRRREQIREGRDMFVSSLRHPTAGARMTAVDLHPVIRDMAYYAPATGDDATASHSAVSPDVV